MNGCDSIIRLHLREEPLENYYITDTLCVGDEYQFGSLLLTAAGNYEQLLSTNDGCDSMVYLTLIEQVEDTLMLNEAICPGIQQGTQRGMRLAK